MSHRARGRWGRVDGKLLRVSYGRIPPQDSAASRSRSATPRQPALLGSLPQRRLRALEPASLCADAPKSAMGARSGREMRLAVPCRHGAAAWRSSEQCRATSGGGGEPQRVRGCCSGLEGDGGGGSVPRRVRGPPGLLRSRAACSPRLAKMPRQPQPAGACLRAPSQPVPRGPRVGGCPVHQWKRLSEQKIAFP